MFEPAKKRRSRIRAFDDGSRQRKQQRAQYRGAQRARSDDGGGCRRKADHEIGGEQKAHEHQAINKAFLGAALPVAIDDDRKRGRSAKQASQRLRHEIGFSPQPRLSDGGGQRGCDLR